MAAVKKPAPKKPGVSNLETVQVPINDLVPFPGNPRTHDLDMIAESLAAHGQYKAIVVRKKDMMILAGHGTVEAARDKLYWTSITAHLIECDDEQARRIVLMDNRSNDKAGYDEPALIALLRDLPDLEATGFAKRDLEHLMAKNAPPVSDPATITPTYEVLVECVDEAAQAELLQRLTEDGLKCRALL